MLLLDRDKFCLRRSGAASVGETRILQVTEEWRANGQVVEAEHLEEELERYGPQTGDGQGERGEDNDKDTEAAVENDESGENVA